MGVHPTAERLIATTVRMLSDGLPEPVTVEAVLEASGVSRGSLYHHFHDFPGLLDHAHVRIFSAQVDTSVAMLTEVYQRSTSVVELRAGLEQVTISTQSARAAANRRSRLAVLSQATQRPQLQALLAAEQQRLSDALADLVRSAQAKGWYRAELDPDTIAVFIQAYTLGKVVDDVASRQLPEDTWNRFIMTIIDTLFIVD